MRKRSITKLTLFFSIILTVSCKTYYQHGTVNFIDYRLDAAAKKDSSMQLLLQPYADSVNKSMNAVIVVTETELEKKQPEGALGNVMVDALFVKAAEAYKTKVDAAFINYGGIRLTTVAPGNITRGKIFELSPFDNAVVLLKLNGKTFLEFLNHISGRGGWPAAGLTWQIKNKQATNILVNGTAINETGTYTIAVTDYVANGGDDCSMLKSVPQINNGYVYRDALIDYLSGITKQGKKISAKIENRVSNAE